MYDIVAKNCRICFEHNRKAESAETTEDREMFYRLRDEATNRALMALKAIDDEERDAIFSGELRIEALEIADQNRKNIASYKSSCVECSYSSPVLFKLMQD